MELKQDVIDTLKDRVTEDDVESVFIKCGVSALETKTKYLNTVMGNPKTFFAGGAPDTDALYEVTLTMFLTGTWKLSSLYKKAYS